MPTDVMLNGAPEHMQRHARSIGPHTEALILAVLARRRTLSKDSAPVSGCCAFRGIDAARAERFSRRAVEIGALSYASVASILKRRFDSRRPPLLHDNIRGSRYYH